MLIFDMDGTLIDSNGVWRDVDIAFLKKRGFPYTKEYYQGVAHTIFPKAAVFTKGPTAISRKAPRRSWQNGWRWPATPTPPECR